MFYLYTLDTLINRLIQSNYIRTVCFSQVRRAALRYQLEHEYSQFQRELKMQGKAFYEQRT